MWRIGYRWLSKRSSGLLPRTQQQCLCSKPSSQLDDSCRRDVLSIASQLKPGDHLSGYTVVKVEPVSELSLVSILLTHDATGAEHLHIARDDANNVFGVGFRTTPMDSTGVPHILEHTTLCGSNKFPCRDPFMKMLNRSLATFMNAFTASDVTMYPFSTQNPKDFQNLLSVYLDAVFYPLLKEQDFWQEGWRLENEDVSSTSTPIVFKGVVFNEMKGAMSTSDSLFAQGAQNNLLPSHTYSYNSGGDPLCIPDLTWEQLKEFHSTHYHPSNSRFFTYGDIPVNQHLEAINELALKHFDKQNTETTIPHEPRWTQPREASLVGPVDSMAVDPNKQTIVSMSYLVTSTLDPFNSFVMNVLSSLLLDGPTSPFYQSLIESNLGSDYSPGTGYDNGTKDSSFSVGLRGVHPDDVDKVKELVHQTFEKVIEEGFPLERIEAVLHRIELSVKHQSANFGLGLMMSLMQPWNHGANPMEYLQVNQRVNQFKECLKEEEQFLQNFIKKQFKENQHCLTVVMNPDSEYESKLATKEKEMLLEKTSKLTPESKEEIFQKCQELAKEQDKVQDSSCLPIMELADIDRKTKPVVLDEYVIAGVPVLFSEQPTNGVTYFSAISSISDIPDNMMPFLPLFCFIITKMGAGNLNYKELSQLIEQRTGGLSVRTHVSTHHTEPNKYEQGVMFSSHCLDKNLPHMFYLWGEIFTNPLFDDKDRLITLINMLTSDLSTSIADAGHYYAMSLASSKLNPAAKLSEMFGGLSQVLFMKNLLETTPIDEVIEKLKAIAVHVLEGTQFRCSVNMVPESRPAVEAALEGYCDSLPGAWTDTSGMISHPEFESNNSKVHFELPFPVNYSSRCFNAVSFNHVDFTKFQVLSKLLSSKFLLREVREKGGAYGGGAKNGGGVFSFYSYRDPNSLDTLDVFTKSVEWAVQGKFSEHDVNEAKLGVFSSVDSPVSPGYRGQAYFTQGITDVMKQLHRDRLFAVTREDIIEVAKNYLSSGMDSVALLGPENELTSQGNDWSIMKETS